MKVILTQDVRGKGKKGQMIEAAEGYARNYLIPRGVAVPATADAVNTMKLRDKAKAKADALKAQYDMDVDSKKLVIDEPIKSFGSYQVKAKLGYEISGIVNVLVVEEK